MATFFPASGTSGTGTTATASATWCAEGIGYQLLGTAASTPTE